MLDRSTLTNANLSGAVVTGADFHATKSHGFTQAQLPSTASYQVKNLQGIHLPSNDLTGWDFGGQNLTYAVLNFSTLTNANLSGAVVTGADFGSTTSRGFTQAQLVSTASYQAKNLHGIQLSFNDLTGWDFGGQNLTNANLFRSTLTNANLSGANLTGADLSYSTTLTNADLSGAVVTGANFDYDRDGFTRNGVTQAQLASTASYRAKNLQGIQLAGNDLTGLDLSGQDLTNANLFRSTLRDADLRGADLKNANLVDAFTLSFAQFSFGSVYNQWTQFPEGFSPFASGLTNSPSSAGDLNANDTLDVADIEMLQQNMLGYSPLDWLPIAMFDLNNDSGVTQDDLTVWIKDLKHSYFGDANLDGEFNSTDIVDVFTAGQYEDETPLNSTWSTGDWDTDGDFTSSDFIAAFVDGGYEAGPRPAVSAVPEPTTVVFLVGLIAAAIVSISRQKSV